MKKKILLLILLTSLSTSLSAKILEVKQLFNIKTTEVKELTISEKKEFYGNIDINEANITDIVLRHNGYITDLFANKDYLPIKKGDILFNIYSEEILNIQNEYQILKNSSIKNSILDKLKNLNIDKKEIKKIINNKINNKGISVYSPSNGIIMNKNINNNSFIPKNKLLMKIVDLDKVWFIAKIYQNDLSFINKNNFNTIYVDGLNYPIKATLDYIYPEVDNNTKTIKVRFMIDNKDMKLFPNMFGKVLVEHKIDNKLVLPVSAVLNKGSNFYVFKPISKTEIEPKKVTVKRISSNQYQVLSGLKKGDKVINNSLFLMDSDAITNSLYSSDEDEDW